MLQPGRTLGRPNRSSPKVVGVRKDPEKGIEQVGWEASSTTDE